MKNLKLDYKILLLNVVVMLAFVVAISFVYVRVEFNFISQKKMEVKHAVESVWGSINHYVMETKSGALSTAEAQRLAIKMVHQTRYAENNYYWINDMAPRMVTHPMMPELDGQDLSEYVDPSGKSLFVEMVQRVKTRQSGFVEYLWPKPGLNQPVQKISFVKGVPEWGWVVGSGLYLDDIYAELAKIRNIFIGVTLLVLCFSLLMTYFAARSISQPLAQAIAMIQDIGNGNLESRLNLQRSDEVGVMAGELNKFADNMQNEILAAFDCLAAGDFTFKAKGVIRTPLEKTNKALAELSANNKKITADLEERKKTIKLLLNSTAEGVYGLDHEGNCTFFNESALRMLGYDEQLLIGRPVHDLIAHTRPDGSHVPTSECLIQKILSAESDFYCNEGILWNRDGDWINVEYRMQPIISDSKTVGAVVSFIDNTDKNKLLEQRMRASQLAALGELSAGMAHEINNPISGVINYAQILLNRKPEGEIENDLLHRIIKEGERIVTIVQSLLSFAHKDRDSMVPINLKKIIEEPLELVQQRLVNDGIFLDIDFADDLPNIFGNVQKLEQVMLNMINNSRHALNEKYPRGNPNKILRISALQIGGKNDSRLQLTVWDQGIGIPQQNLKKIFNTFFTTKPAGVGTGLGLSLSHDIITEHGATINIESEYGFYTKIVMEFPVYKKRGEVDKQAQLCSLAINKQPSGECDRAV